MSLLSISDNPSNSKDETGSPGTGIAFRPVPPGAQTPLRQNGGHARRGGQGQKTPTNLGNLEKDIPTAESLILAQDER